MPKQNNQSKARPSVVLPGGHRLLVWPDDWGYEVLGCPCDQYQKHQMCDHVLQAYNEKLDSYVVRMVVTIFIKPTPLHVRVLLIKESDGFMRVQIVWRADPMESASIGFLRNNTSRGFIRPLVMEWLPSVPTLFSDRMRCESSFHTDGTCEFDGIMMETLWAMDPTTEKGRRVLAEGYTLLETGQCMACQSLLPID